MEAGAEVPIQTESKPIVGKKDYAVGENKVEVTFVKFDGQEHPDYDPKRAALLLTGWPMRADAQITWGQPGILAKEFGVTTYEIDGRPKGNFEGNTIDLELEGIRQFAAELEQTGINKLTLFGHSIGASKAVDLAVSLEEKNPNLKVNVVLINPAGLYPQDVLDIVKAYAAGAGINKDTKNPKRISQDFIPVLINIAASIFKDMKDTKLNIFKLWRDQGLKVSEFNANLAKIKSPVMVMVATNDPVFTPEGVFPPEQIDSRIASIMPEDQLREELGQSGKWENLSADEKARYGNKEAFIEDYLKHTQKIHQMMRVRRAREEYLKEIMPNAEGIRVVIAEKYGNHIAFGVERPKPSTYLIARTLKR